MKLLALKSRLYKRIEHLTDAQLEKLDSFFEQEFNGTSVSARKPYKERPIGLRKGALKYMADDFDAPLDCFKDYMPEQHPRE